MRCSAALVAVALASIPVLAQEEKMPAPKGSETVLIGCLSGNTLIVRPKGSKTDVTYALRASKERMRALKELEHTQVEVVGFVHDTATHTSRGKVVTSADGKTRLSANAAEDKGSIAPTPPTIDLISATKVGGPCR